MLLSALRSLLAGVLLPYEPVRRGAYYVSTALSHPLGLAVVAFLIWRSNARPGGHDVFGFLFTMIGYYGLIALPAGFVRNITRPGEKPLPSMIPKEAAWPASAPVTVAVPAVGEDTAPGEAAMWARLDPLLRRIARPPLKGDTP